MPCAALHMRACYNIFTPLTVLEHERQTLITNP
jgi:hypothetical protein